MGRDQIPWMGVTKRLFTIIRCHQIWTPIPQRPMDYLNSLFPWRPIWENETEEIGDRVWQMKTTISWIAQTASSPRTVSTSESWGRKAHTRQVSSSNSSWVLRGRSLSQTPPSGKSRLIKDFVFGRMMKMLFIIWPLTFATLGWRRRHCQKLNIVNASN